jgi:hypothetical protein
MRDRTGTACKPSKPTEARYKKMYGGTLTRAHRKHVNAVYTKKAARMAEVRAMKTKKSKKQLRYDKKGNKWSYS